MHRRRATSGAADSSPSEGFEIERIIDRIDRVEGKERHARQHPRHRFRHSGVKLRLEHPGGTRSVLLVWTRNISQGGMSMLHTSFVHPGSHCRISVPRTDGEVQDVYAQVRWCRLLSGVVHEFGVQFEEPLEMELFVNVARLAGDAAAPEPTSNAAAARADLVGEAQRMMNELDQLFITPNLNRAVEVCDRVQQIGTRLDCSPLSDAALSARQMLLVTSSVAKSESLLRRVQHLSRSLSDSAHPPGGPSG